MNCRHCGKSLTHLFLDLGFAPPSNAYLSADDLHRPEIYFPLRLWVCDYCWLVQTEDYARAEALFRPDYAYFSSTSSTWLDHAARYVAMIRERLVLGRNSLVIEIAANDGYLLRNFIAAGIPCLGIEPTASTAVVAEAQGIPILREFFGQKLAGRLATEGRQADLIIGNNVYAHVPDINDFTAGLKVVLKPSGVITLEFPHLLRLIKDAQFDTVYHEHFSYLSLHTVNQIFNQADLRIWEVERLPTHGGSLRIYGCHAEDSRSESLAVGAMLEEERRGGLQELATYRAFQPHADRVKNDLLAFLLEQKGAARTVVAYGAAAKGNTLLNYAGVKPDLLSWVGDAAPSKQGRYLPGSHIPIVYPERIAAERPDYILILPWNLREEISRQLAFIRKWGGRFVTAVPHLEVVEVDSSIPAELRL